MSVLIRGMDMPKDCFECQLLSGDTSGDTSGDITDWVCHAANRWLGDKDFWQWYAYEGGRRCQF